MYSVHVYVHENKHENWNNHVVYIHAGLYMTIISKITCPYMLRIHYDDMLCYNVILNMAG